MSIDDDIKLTLVNKKKLESNKNLMFWYRECFNHQMDQIKNTASLRILEIGSGTSPFKKFFTKIITSDIMPLKHVDHCFDALKLSEYKELKETPVDSIVMTNVLHHLPKPLKFFKEATKILNKEGEIIMTEPFFSFISTPIYKYIHHEPVEFNIKKPELEKVMGPLSSANQALPYCIFNINHAWRNEVLQDFHIDSVQHFSSLSYFLTGGISRNLPFSLTLYRMIFRFDNWLAQRYPKIFSSFMTIKLIKKC